MAVIFMEHSLKLFLVPFLLQQLKPEQIEVDIIRVEESEKSGVESAQLDAQVELRSSARKTRIGSGMRLTVELIKF